MHHGFVCWVLFGVGDGESNGDGCGCGCGYCGGCVGCSCGCGGGGSGGLSIRGGGVVKRSMFCTRCGRGTHVAAKCYARCGVDGKQLYEEMSDDDDDDEEEGGSSSDGDDY